MPGPKTNPDSTAPSVQIRKVTQKDIPAIVAIENQQFLHPWKEHYFTSELTHDLSYFFLAEKVDTAEVMGYIIFWIIEETMELHNIAVSARFKKKGIGKQLLLFLLETAEQNGVEEVFLEVRRSNAEAIGFYEAFKFKRISIRKNYYDNPREDALIFKLEPP
jgi:[ribosomal protein S18]-alanine N-acetyltransferase